MSPRKRRLREKLGSLYLWHRYAGLIAALLAAWLAVTGMLLNHTEDLRLSHSFVEQRWLLDLYGIKAPRDLRGENIGGHWLTQSADRIYVDDDFVGSGRAAGAALTEFGFVVAFRDRLQLYTTDAVLVEDLPFTATSAPLTGIASHPDGVLVIAGQERFIADPGLLAFKRVEADVQAPQRRLKPLPESLAEQISRDVLQHSLNWERVLLDLHAGRLFGTAGRWLADIAGALLLLLALSGIVIWAQRARARRRHR